MTKILITGAGSLIGQGLIRTLKFSKKKYTVFGTDYFSNAIGLYWAKRSYILPDILKKKNIEKKWVRKIINIININKINYLIPGLDFEIPLFSKYKKEIEKKTNCIVFVSDSKIVETFRDKWKTIQFLKRNKFHHPKTCLPVKIKNFLKYNKFPLIVKPRVGSTSKNVLLVNNLSELKNAIKSVKKPIIQEYLYKKNNEFTCGVIFDQKKKKLLSSIVLQRDLKHGNTKIAKLLKNNEYRKIDKFIIKITNQIKPFGPLNFQLCYYKQKPFIFEINPRFSGTTPLRNFFGLNEIDLLIDSYENKSIKKINLKQGIIIRYLTDHFIKKLKKFK